MVAAGEERHQRKRLHFVTEEGNLGYLVFKINIKDLFSSDLQPQSAATEMEIRNLPGPVAQFQTLAGVPERMDFALVGTTIVGVSCSNRTVMYDTRSGVYSAGPEPQHEKCGGSYVVELGHRLYALKRLFTAYDEEQPCGESLLLHPPPAQGAPRREPWRALPEPPADFRRLDLSNSSCQVTAYFTAGTRLWVSAKRRGTYSLDTVRRVWRKEGDWELPFHYRGLLIAELGNLCFGLCRETNCLCACDIQQSPPVVRYVWEETFPQWPSGVRANAMYPQGNLAYLGDGKFCIGWTIGIGDHSCLRRAIFLMALQVIHTSGELRMVKHKVCCYEMPHQGRMAYVL